MDDKQRDRLAIPSSSMTDDEYRRNQQYDDEARSQDMSDAGDRARDESLRRMRRERPSANTEASRSR